MYKRTSGYRNWVNRRCWLPVFSNNGNAARLKSGRFYRVTGKGWVRVSEGEVKNIMAHK